MNSRPPIYTTLQNYEQNQSCLDIPKGICSRSDSQIKKYIQENYQKSEKNERNEVNKQNRLWYWETLFLDTYKKSEGCSFGCLPNR